MSKELKQKSKEPQQKPKEPQQKPRLLSDKMVSKQELEVYLPLSQFYEDMSGLTKEQESNLLVNREKAEEYQREAIKTQENGVCF